MQRSTRATALRNRVRKQSRRASANACHDFAVQRALTIILAQWLAQKTQAHEVHVCGGNSW